jgi:hypothetical protein
MVFPAKSVELNHGGIIDMRATPTVLNTMMAYEKLIVPHMKSVLVRWKIIFVFNSQH